MVNLAYLYGLPNVTADYKVQPSDFIVEEDLGFEPDGDGEHVVLYLQKQGYNTQFVAERVAQFAGISPKLVSYSGLKDRNAVTMQWFSLHMPGQATPDFSQFTLSNCRILKTSRQRKKLRIGVHKGNHFTLLLRNISDNNALDNRLHLLSTTGILNYFGEQRFGIENQNQIYAQRWASGEITVKNRRKRAFYLSAVRSILFNNVVSLRVTEQLHHRVLSGDVIQLQGSNSWFVAKPEESNVLQHRLEMGDIALTAPLVGSGELDSHDLGRALEIRALEKEPLFWELVQREKMQMGRRPILIRPKKWCWQWQTESEVELKFWLPAGSYATSVLRELIR